MNIKDLLPIGSVVLLRGGIKKMMIMGIKIATQENPDNYYDYIGVMYPEGFMGEKQNFLFNHEEINDVVFMGYSNLEHKEFLAQLDKLCEGQ